MYLNDCVGRTIHDRRSGKLYTVLTEGFMYVRADVCVYDN